MAQQNPFKRFVQNKAGNVAMMTGILLIPMMAAVGAAVDYSRVNSYSNAYQQSADAAVLAASKVRDQLSDTELKKFARAVFDANLGSEAAKVLNFELYTTGDNKLALKADGRVDSSFIGIVGIKNMALNVLSEVQLPQGNIEVVLVVDNTGSMNSSGKIGALKTAAKNFTNQIMQPRVVQEKRAQIAVVPFSSYVNVGKNNRNRNWISVPRESRNKKWHGCVGSRSYPRNLKDEKFGKERVPGLLNVSCVNEMLTLSRNKNKILQSIQKLTASGSTYIPAGISWGVRVLSSKSPFTAGASPTNIAERKTNQVMILMTDGENTISKNRDGRNDSAYHNGRDVGQTNKWTLEACTYAKSKAITVYTVTFGKGLSNATRKLMLNCATSADHYFDATSGADLDVAFGKIGAHIKTVYLSR
ncbi:MAG: TadE/TadG family type IV pilus assembly protein [Pseudomonadota bacterium]